MAKRVFELARELGVTSKVVLEKCRAEGLDIKNHMSTLSMGLGATIQEWFSEAAGGTAIERAEHVDLNKARAEARKRHPRKSAKKAEEEAVAAAMEAQARAAELVEAPAAAVPEATAPTEAEIAVAPAAEVQAEPEAAVAAEPPPQHVKQAPSVEAAEQARPEEPAKPAEQEIKPAGPQVVPKPARLKGPRVVRVERPDFVPGRVSPRGPALVAGPSAGGGLLTPSAAGEEQEGRGKKKAKRRSARHQGARVADTGEKLREWRDQDLQERSARLAAAGVGLHRYRAAVSRKRPGVVTPGKTGKVEIEEPITIKSLSAATGIKAADIIRKLLQLGLMATVNQVINRETVETVVLDYNIELQIKAAKTAEQEMLEGLESRPKGQLLPRAPVATFLGHVDHGKTSLLDRIRNTAVAEGEAGGITQHIGACRYDKGDTHVVFLDTPGHEAFTAMRARGANMTDVVVLVVAADDGVMPQTVEAIHHARAAKVPIVVALNKIDVPNANLQRALGQLAEQGLNPREWGGDVEVVRTSAVTGEGIEDLVEVLSLEAELLELRAETDAPASGYVIEAEMDPGVGVKCRLLVRNGALKIGDILLAGKSYGRVRQMMDDRGRTLQQAGPATPVEATGLDEVPEAGDRFFVVPSLEQARYVATDRQQLARTKELAVAQPRSLQEMLRKIEAGQTDELALIIKADVQGSLEALTGSLEKLGTDEVKVNILHAAAGGISTGDVALAEASSAIIIGFNVVPDASAKQLAESEGVDIRLYRVIYDVIGDVRKALEEGLAPEVREEVLGQAEVRQIFKVSRVGTVAGCFVTDGTVNRNAKVRLIRNNIVVEDERTLDSLRRFKEDVREVRAGLECGVKIAGYDDLKEGDVLAFYRQVEVARSL